jgi:hypothetical protein
MINILYIFIALLFSSGFTIPDNCEYRKLYPDELRTMRQVVSKANRIAWYLIDTETLYFVPINNIPGWSPVDKNIPDLESTPKVILIVLSEYFLGRYEFGVLIEWTNMLAGKTTKPGIYRVMEKDKDHYSKSYKTSDGRDCPMPNALQIYENVWIHGGDAYLPAHISHDCINIVNSYAEELFDWSDKNTVVVIVQ